MTDSFYRDENSNASNSLLGMLDKRKSSFDPLSYNYYRSLHLDVMTIHILRLLAEVGYRGSEFKTNCAEIANAVGRSTETVSKALHKLEAKKAITLRSDGHGFYISVPAASNRNNGRIQRDFGNSSQNQNSPVISSDSASKNVRKQNPKKLQDSSTIKTENIIDRTTTGESIDGASVSEPLMYTDVVVPEITDPFGNLDESFPNKDYSFIYELLSDRFCKEEIERLIDLFGTDICLRAGDEWWHSISNRMPIQSDRKFILIEIRKYYMELLAQKPIIPQSIQPNTISTNETANAQGSVEDQFIPGKANLEQIKLWSAIAEKIGLHPLIISKMLIEIVDANPERVFPFAPGIGEKPGLAWESWTDNIKLEILDELIATEIS